MGTTCLIPCYNEKNRIGVVLGVIMRIRQITQVVCVDDGSTDGTTKYLEQNWPQVQVVKLSHNRGKAAAVREGLKAVENDVVLLMDADLQDLRQEEIEDAIQAFIWYEQIDMIILRRMKSPWFVKFYRSDVLLSGERLLRKCDLEQILEQRVLRYQLEVAINRYMLRGRKVVRWMPCSALNTYKLDKWGLAEGAKRELFMYLEIVYFVGLVHMVQQLASFRRKLRFDRSAEKAKAKLWYQFRW